MAEDTGFNATATTLSRNPLGIIALFIVLVYAMAALTVGLSKDSLGELDKSLMVAFLVIFPVLVLGVFTFLVGWRTKTLYAPSDFTDQQHWVDLQKQKEAAVQMAAVTLKNNEGVAAAPATSDIVERSTVAAERAASFARSAKRPSNGILWVDDNPEKVAGLRRAFENFKIPVEMATGNAGALSLARQRPFDAIVTDMEHDDDKAAAFTLAEQLRDAKITAPVIVFTTAKNAASKDTRRNLVSAVTSSAADLFQAVTRAVGG